ncbi:MAG: hypothetical protein WD766_06630, partial [Gemmatimonadota bacterium]
DPRDPRPGGAERPPFGGAEPRGGPSQPSGAGGQQQGPQGNDPEPDDRIDIEVGPDRAGDSGSGPDLLGVPADEARQR